MTEQEPRRKDKDAFIATLYRMDPDRLRTLRRVTSGVTRCPECDHPNPAQEKVCTRCGARLYPVEEAEEAWLDGGKKKSDGSTD